MIRCLLSALIGGFPVITGRVGRIAKPGQWVVWAEDGRVCVEIKA